MARNKELVVCVLDVGPSMADDTYGAPRLDQAKNAVTMLIRHKLLYSAKDDVGVVLFGCDETENELAETLGGYDNVVVHRELAPPNVDVLREIPTIAGASTPADVTDALVVAVDLLKKKLGKKKGKCRVFLVTDGAGEVQDAEQLPSIIEQFEAMSCKLDVIADFGDSAEAEQTEVMKRNQQLLRQMAAELDGQFLEATKAIDMLCFAQARAVKQTSKFRGPLELSPVCSIPVWTFGKTVQQRLPSMSKLSLPGVAAGGDGKVKMDRSYRSMTDTNKAVEKEDRIKGYKYGPQLVPFTAADEATMKYTSTKCLQVIAFVDRAKVPRHHFMSGVDCVVAEPGNETASNGLSGLIHALRETKRCVIVRYIKRANSSPWLAVLTPYVAKLDRGPGDKEPDGFECLYLNKLPFQDDLREYPFEDFNSEDKYKPSVVQLAAAEQLIDGLDLMTAHVEEDGTTTEALAPAKTFNPVLQRFHQALQARALEPDCVIPPLDPVIERYVVPDEALFKREAGCVKDFKNNFELKKNDTKKKKKRRFWGDVDEGAAETKGASAGAGAGAGAGAADEDDDVDMSVDALFSSGPVDAVGSVDPVKDFQAMIRRRDADLVGKATEGMRKQVRRLVEEGGATFYEKAISCLKALRAGSLANYAEKEFNTFLQDLKRDYESGAHKPFWEEMVKALITLITNEESPSLADVTKADADRFLSAPSSAPAPVAAPEPEDDDDDDLFDDMA